MQRTLKTQDFPASLHLLAQCAGTHLLYLEVGLMLGVVNLIILPFSCSTPGSYFSSLFTQCYVSTVISLFVPHDILIGSFILRLIFLGLWTPPPSSTPCVELMFTHAVVFRLMLIRASKPVTSREILVISAIATVFVLLQQQHNFHNVSLIINIVHVLWFLWSAVPWPTLCSDIESFCFSSCMNTSQQHISQFYTKHEHLNDRYTLSASDEITISHTHTHISYHLSYIQPINPYLLMNPSVGCRRKLENLYAHTRRTCNYTLNWRIAVKGIKMSLIFLAVKTGVPIPLAPS